MLNIVAIVGRPNVGKSTLFNRLTESRDAIVDPTSGVTRDRHYGRSEWNGMEFTVVDTGGYVVGSEDVFEEAIRKQVELAIDEAALILFVVDVVEGITPLDEEVAAFLRKKGCKNVVLVANKVDNTARLADASVFYGFGLGDVYSISSINGSGTGELLDYITKSLDRRNLEEEETELPRFAVVGRPNVGKSTFINALLGEERNIVTPIAGTTRDTIYTEYNKFGLHFMLVDTAGLRKKGKVYENIEFYSVMRSIKAIENADVCFVVIDATNGLEAQDLNIFSLAERNMKGVVVLVNKWDLVDKNQNTHLEFEKQIKERIAPFTDVPVIFISATDKQRILKAIQTGMQVYKNRTNKISTSELNDVLLPIIESFPPPTARGNFIKVKYITQLKTHYPSFIFFCNHPQYVKDPYKRFLENKLRENFDFKGVPIKIYFRNK